MTNGCRRAFAASAATAPATAVTVQAERRRQRMAAAEQERAHWARELHDETLQNLAALRLGLGAQLRDPTPETAVEAAIEDPAERARGRGLGVELAIDLAYEQGRERTRHVTEVETAMYRIVQEALNNAAKHGQARVAHVEVVEDHSTVRITVAEDGRGFDPAAQTDGFGLIGMHERLELLDGTLKVNSSSGRGTTIEARFPARHREESDQGDGAVVSA